MTRDARSHTRNLFQNLSELLPASRDIWGNLQKVSEAADAGYKGKYGYIPNTFPFTICKRVSEDVNSRTATMYSAGAKKKN
jgi:hypothetical protein